jgi:stage II sporulation protein D
MRPLMTFGCEHPIRHGQRVRTLFFKNHISDLAGFTMRAAVLLFLFFAVATTKVSSGQELEAANRLWWNGAYEEAALRYTEITRPSDEKLRALLECAALNRSTGDYGAAIELYRAVLAEGSGEVVREVLIPLGESCYYINRLKVAEEVFRRALALEPHNLEALFGLGRVLLAENNLQDAASMLQEAAALEPSFSGSYIYLARIAEMQSDPRGAIAYYQKALQIDSQHAELLFPLGQAFVNVGLWEDAYRQFYRLRNIDGKNPLVLSKLEEIRPQLTRTEGEVVPPKSLESFKPAPAVSVPPGMPVLRIGLNTTSGGSVIGMKSLSFVTNGPFVLRADAVPEGTLPEESALFEGSSGTEYRIFMNNGKTLIGYDRLDETPPLQELPQTFSIEVVKTDASGMQAGSIIIRTIEYARGYAWSGVEDRQYRGRLEVRAGSEGLRLVNVISLEEYLYGVLPSEMSISFPQEALKAQAVIARSFALYRKRIVRPHRNDGFDLCDSQHCQVYRGASNEWEKTTRAVDDTRGEVLMSGGRLASPLFHANCGGHTQSSRDLEGWGDVSYLTGVPDGPPDLSFPSSPVSLERWLKSHPPAYCGTVPFNEGPEFRWFRLIPADLLQEKLDRFMGIGRIGKITVLRRNPAGYVHSVEIRGARGTVIIGKEHEIRRFLGVGPLRSNLFWIETRFDTGGYPEEFLLYGGGWGHGVGLCQDGAGGMASRGFTYQDILAHYYTGTDLLTIDY